MTAVNTHAIFPQAAVILQKNIPLCFAKIALAARRIFPPPEDFLINRSFFRAVVTRSRFQHAHPKLSSKHLGKDSALPNNGPRKAEIL
jgi:hypothetical protein